MRIGTDGRITRRRLLAQTPSLTAGVALSTTRGSLFAQLASAAATPPRRWAAHPGLIQLDTVQLKDGPYRDAMIRNRAYLLSLDPDRFLFYFRSTAGLAAKAAPYGGWEEKVGRMLGHYLSACSMYARSTAEQALVDRQNYIVAELAACQRANGNGYVGGVPDAKRIFKEIGAGNIYIDRKGLNGVHAPWYMLHKMAAGLRDAYAYGRNEQALVVLTGFSDWAYDLTTPLSQSDVQKMLQDEHGGMNEVFADLFSYTGKQRYLELSRRFNREAVLEPLTRGVDDLDGLHANTQIPTVIGLYRQYEVSDDPSARRGGEFFWETVTRDRSYANGGDSDKEHFYPRGQMGQNLSAATAETCNSYNMVKLTDRLFANSPRPEYAEYNERVLWNHILASLDRDTPGMTYYMSLKPGHFKTFSKPVESFWCCVGTGMENHAKYGESLYLHSANELWINQFIASELTWKEKGIRLTQATTFPIEAESRWTINCQAPVSATIYLRHPTWAGEMFDVKLNGKPCAVSRPGTYLKLQRTWRDGDVLTAKLPMSLRVEPMPDDPALKAIFYGPLLLAGLMGRESMPRAAPYAGNDQLEFRSVPDPPVPSLVLDPGRLDTSIKQTGRLEFAAKSSGGETIRFVPLADISHDRYSVYWKTS